VYLSRTTINNGFNRKLMYIFVLNGDRSPRWAWRPYLYWWGFISSAGEAAVAMLTSPFISNPQARGPPKTWLLRRLPFTRPFLDLYGKNKPRLGLQQIYISDPDWRTEIDVIPRNEKAIQRVKRCLGDRETVSVCAFFSLIKNASNINEFRRHKGSH